MIRSGRHLRRPDQGAARRHVVERCIYGVDINPLAVEFARVSLWVETLDPELPFSFLDHKIKVGNSLVGCWLDRVLDYPLKAWEREGGDGKDGAPHSADRNLLKGTKSGNRRSGDGSSRRRCGQLIERRFQGVRTFFSMRNTTTRACGDQGPRRSTRSCTTFPDYDPEERERYYREHSRTTAMPVRRLKEAMDEWCAVWFWPADEESLKHVPTPGTSTATRTAETSAVLRRSPRM